MRIPCALIFIDYEILEKFQHTGLVPGQPSNDQPDQATLADSFVLSVKQAARPGLGLNG